jgi:methylamine utilization protein MauE
MGSEAALIAVNAATSAVLIVAGAGKLVAPHQLVKALRSLVAGQQINSAVVRGLAAVEIGAGVLLTIPATRLPAAGLAGLLGLAFAAAGITGMARRSTTSCGCFGSTGGDRRGRPLGAWNVGLGVFLAAVPPLNGGTELTATDPFVASALSTAVAMVAVALWMYRRLVHELTRPLPENPAVR